MPPLTNISVINDIIQRSGFSFSKSLGQNFLINPSVCPRMAKECGADSESGVIEIGPGIGVLTSELARVARKVVAIEIDERLPPILADTLSEHNNIKIVCADVMKIDLAQLIQNEFPDMNVCICANLPYYITSPVIMRLLELRLPVKSITVMVQREAAARITASPGTREAGAISAAISYYSRPRQLFQVSRGSFMPAPNVDSAVIRLDIRDEPPVFVQNEDAFFRIVKAAFAQRRKTVLNSLSASLPLNKEAAAQLLDSACVSANARAEQLTLDDFAAIANALANSPYFSSSASDL